MNPFSLHLEDCGASPRLRPGDVVRVGTHIGVISESQVVVDGCGCNWDDVKPVKYHANRPSYSIKWRTGTGLKSAWWQTPELDAVVKLGPFHGYESY